MLIPFSFFILYSYNSAQELFDEVDQVARDAQARARKAQEDATDLLNKARNKLPTFDTSGLQDDAADIIQRVSYGCHSGEQKIVGTLRFLHLIPSMQRQVP